MTEIYVVSACRVYGPDATANQLKCGFSRFFTSGWFHSLIEAEQAIREHSDAVFESGQLNVAVVERVTSGFTTFTHDEWWFKCDDDTCKIKAIDKPEILHGVVGFCF